MKENIYQNYSDVNCSVQVNFNLPMWEIKYYNASGREECPTKIKGGKAKGFVQMLRRNRILKHVTEGKTGDALNLWKDKKEDGMKDRTRYWK